MNSITALLTLIFRISISGADGQDEGDKQRDASVGDGGGAARPLIVPVLLDDEDVAVIALKGKILTCTKIYFTKIIFLIQSVICAR